MLLIVTGATGFIGTHVIKALANVPTIEVIGVGRQAPVNGRFVRADLSQRGWTRLLPKHADVVLHLAQSPQYRQFPQGIGDMCAINVDATVELAEWAMCAGLRRLVFASSGNVYGSTSGPTNEAAPTLGRSMYAASKLGAEILLRPFANSYEILILRLFGIYGPGQTDALIPDMIERVRTGHEITLAKGIGVRLNPLYIEDCARIVLALMDVHLASRYEIVNVGGAETVTLAEVVSATERLVGATARVVDTAESPTELVGDIDKLSRLVSMDNLVSIGHGLSRIIIANGSGHA